MKDADVVVVGGGPAGSVTALLLARAGWHVELLERREFPRAKPCGDCISPGANKIFRRLGVWDAILAAQPARLRGWLIAARPDTAFTTRFASAIADAELHDGIALPREKLDAILLDAARAAGAIVRTGVQVMDVAREPAGAVVGVQAQVDGVLTKVGGRLTVGADGLRSRVARRLDAYARGPRLKKFSLTAHVQDVPGVADLGEMHTDGRACLGIAPVSATSSLFNITTVAHATCAHPGDDARDAMRRLLRRFPDRDLPDLIRDDTTVLASGPFDWPTRCTTFDGAVLVGDAAGYYDPYTGQGIYQAIAGAEALAEHSHRALRNRKVTARALAQFAATEHERLAASRLIQHAIEYVCARPRLARAVFAGLAHSPDIASRLVGVTGDARPVRDLLSPLVLTRLVLATSVHALA